MKKIAGLLAIIMLLVVSNVYALPVEKITPFLKKEVTILVDGGLLSIPIQTIIVDVNIDGYGTEMVKILTPSGYKDIPAIYILAIEDSEGNCVGECGNTNSSSNLWGE